MSRLSIALTCLALSAGSAALYADVIPYPNPGTIAPTVSLTATATGDVTGYFFGANAGGTDFVRLFDVTTGFTSDWYFNNQTTPAGTIQDFGFVNAGDTLVFQLDDTGLVDGIFASDPTYSDDGINHAYVTGFSGDKGIPSGIFVGMEDLPNGSSDLDYNDTTFIFTNVAAVPEPGSFALLGTGILSAAGLIRRRINTK